MDGWLRGFNIGIIIMMEESLAMVMLLSLLSLLLLLLLLSVVIVIVNFIQHEHVIVLVFFNIIMILTTIIMNNVLWPKSCQTRLSYHFLFVTSISDNLIATHGVGYSGHHHLRLYFMRLLPRRGHSNYQYNNKFGRKFFSI